MKRTVTIDEQDFLQEVVRCLVVSCQNQYDRREGQDMEEILTNQLSGVGCVLRFLFFSDSDNFEGFKTLMLAIGKEAKEILDDNLAAGNAENN